MSNGIVGREEQPAPLNIQWVGHACFRIWSGTGPVVVTDPYTPYELGLGPTQLSADIVIASSLDDSAHSDVQRVEGSPTVVNALALARDAVRHEGLEIIVASTRESLAHPTGSKENAMYAFPMGGLWILHMGDAGEALSEAELSVFADRCDVLLALVGGGLTIPLEDLDQAIEYLRPRWIVPMHYALPGMSTRSLPVAEFLRRRTEDRIVLARRSCVQISNEVPAHAPTIIVLRSAAVEEAELADADGVTLS